MAETAAQAAPPDVDVELRPACTAEVAPLAKLYAAAFEQNPAYRWIFSGTVDQPAPPGALEWLFVRRVRMLLHCGCPLLVAVDRGSGRLVGAAALSPFSRKPGMWHFVWNGIALWPLWYGWASFSRVLNIDKKLARLATAGNPASVNSGSGSGSSSGNDASADLAGKLSSNGSDSTGASRDAGGQAGSDDGRRKGAGITGELVMMAVAPPWQGRGIGRRLLRALLALWDAENGGGLVLATQEEHALRLYKAHGFQEREDGPATPAAAPADSRSSDGPTAVAGTAGMAAQDPGNGGGAAYKSWALVRPAQLPPAEAVK